MNEVEKNISNQEITKIIDNKEGQIGDIKILKGLLEEKINNNDIIIISPHKNPDCDALASSLSLVLIANKFDKNSYILIDDIKIENATKTILDSVIEDIKIITSSELEEIVGDKKALLVTADTNKKDLVPITDYSLFNDIVLIDHHNVGSTTIETDNKYIDTNASSASEILYNLLDLFKISIGNCSKKHLNMLIVNCLLAGISLDTAKFTKNTSFMTHEIISKLMRKGADINYINDIFIDDFESDKKYMSLACSATVTLYNILIAINENDPDFIYDRVELAKCAELLLHYKSVDAAFAIGKVSDTEIFVSGRSKGEINIANIMSHINGGGSPTSGGSMIIGCDVRDVKEKILEISKPGYIKSE